MNVLKVGDRVRIVRSGHEGRIVEIDFSRDTLVMFETIDRTHRFYCRAQELELVESDAAEELDIAMQTFAPLDSVLAQPDGVVHKSEVEGVTKVQAKEIAAKASDLVGGDRDRQHGAKHDNFSRIANMWNAWSVTRRDPAASLTAHDVGVMMALMKLARTQSGSLNIDDYVDACGYAACAGEVAQDEAA